MNRCPRAHHAMPSDEHFMREALALARRGLGRTHPNPAVGCVVVRGGRIVGRGWHKRAGQPHAEVEALRSLASPSLARGATVFVTLEPCSTHGRTPPCTRALIEADVGRVVVGAIDPNPKHRGRGLKILRKAGIAVAAGVLAEECAELNSGFHHSMATGLPWVIAKCGMSLDGRLTRPAGESPWITSTAARADAMKLRRRVDAILVGAATVRADDPALTVRGGRCPQQPWRVVWAPRRPPQQEARLLTDANCERTLVLRDKSLRGALRKLARRGVMRVLVEGGGHTLGCIFREGLAQEVVFYVAPMLAGGDVSAVAGPAQPPERAAALGNLKATKIGQCLRLSGLVRAACDTGIANLIKKNLPQ